MKTLNQIQEEIKVWSLKNFGQQDPVLPLLGIIEELGELNIAWRKDDTEIIIDSIGDTIIYMMDFCGRMNYNLEEITIHAAERHPPNRTEDISVVAILGNLCHGYLKSKQNIRTNENHDKTIKNALGDIFFSLAIISQRNENIPSLAECLNSTWDKVSKRDWTQNKENGQ